MKRLLFWIGIMFPLIALGLLAVKIQNLQQQVASARLSYESLSDGSSVPVGAFPSNMDAIIGLIGETQTKLTIVCDYAGYGHYSRPLDYLRYEKEILKLAAKNTPVAMFVYDRGAMEKAQRLQLKWDEIRDTDPVKSDEAKLKLFMDTNFVKERPRIQKDLNNLLFSLQEKHQKDFKDAGVSMGFVSVPLPIHIWKNEKTAIYSLYNLGKGATETSFRTKDPKTLDMLDRIYEDVREKRLGYFNDGLKDHN